MVTFPLHWGCASALLPQSSGVLSFPAGLTQIDGPSHHGGSCRLVEYGFPAEALFFRLWMVFFLLVEHELIAFLTLRSSLF